MHLELLTVICQAAFHSHTQEALGILITKHVIRLNEVFFIYVILRRIRKVVELSSLVLINDFCMTQGGLSKQNITYTSITTIIILHGCIFVKE